MLPTIKKILYATDLSPNSVFAFRFASAIARQHGARIVILHVLERIQGSTKALIAAYISEEQIHSMEGQKREKVMGEIRRRLDRFCEEECRLDAGLMERVERIEVCEGYPAEEILQQAKKYDCDLIVMGSHGKGLLENTFVGSVTRQVLRRTRLPVTVIPLPKGQVEEPPGAGALA
jgi:nucleotide-binding universal stress UspA family protein